MADFELEFGATTSNKLNEKWGVEARKIIDIATTNISRDAELAAFCDTQTPYMTSDGKNLLS